MKWLTLIFLILVVSASGCSTYIAAIETRSANAADLELKAAIWSACEAPTVGAVKRRFKTDEAIAVYFEQCKSLRQ
jgi:hypothetical protein